MINMIVNLSINSLRVGKSVNMGLHAIMVYLQNGSFKIFAFKGVKIGLKRFFEFFKMRLWVVLIDCSHSYHQYCIVPK